MIIVAISGICLQRQLGTSHFARTNRTYIFSTDYIENGFDNIHPTLKVGQNIYVLFYSSVRTVLYIILIIFWHTQL